MVMVVAGRFGRVVVCVRVHTGARIRAREYRDSSLKIQMEYRAFEERSPRGGPGTRGEVVGFGGKAEAGEVEG